MTKKFTTSITHSDFLEGVLGRLTAPLIVCFTNKEHVNPNTAFAWKLAPILSKHFDIQNEVPMKGSIGITNHIAFFCKRKKSKQA